MCLDGAALKKRQANRRTGAPEQRPGIDQIAESQRLQTDQRPEVDRRKEPGSRDLYLACRRLDPLARRDDVGTSTEQIGLDARRNTARSGGRKRRTGDRLTAVRPGSDQRGKLVAADTDVLGDRREVVFRQGDFGIGAAQARQVVEPAAVALGDKVSRRPAIGEYRRSIFVFAVESAQFGIGGGDRDRQHEPGLRGIDHRRAGLRGRRCMGGAVATP